MGKARRRRLFQRFGERALALAQGYFERKDAVGAERAGAKLGDLVYRLDRKHRERTLSNLALAFPDWEPKRREETAREVFRHFGRVMGDFLRSPVRTDAEVAANIEVENPRHYLEALASGKGVIAVTAHLGNWERFAQWVRTTGHHISVVARDADQAGVQARILAIRQSTGLTVLSRGSSAREILKLLRQGEVVGILPDQNTDECFVPFFGHPCGTVLGPAVLHQRTGAVLLPSYCVRTGPAKYRVIFGEPIDWDNEEKDQVALTTQMSAVLESVIRQYPEQWLWMHDRWKAARRKGLL